MPGRNGCGRAKTLAKEAHNKRMEDQSIREKAIGEASSGSWPPAADVPQQLISHSAGAHDENGEDADFYRKRHEKHWAGLGVPQEPFIDCVGTGETHMRAQSLVGPPDGQLEADVQQLEAGSLCRG